MRINSEESGAQWAKTNDPRITVSLKSDDESRMGLITEIHSQLRKAQALKLNYSSLTKSVDI